MLSAGLLVLGLAACSVDDEEATQSGSAGGNSSSSPTSPESDSDTEPSDKDSEDAAQAAGIACLVGTWVVDNKHFGALLQGVAGATNVADPTGEVLITFAADGQYSVTYNAWTVQISQEGMTVDLVRDGTDNGTYQAEVDGHITTSETDMGSVSSMAIQGGSHSMTGEPSTTAGTFTCQGDGLEVTAEGATSVMTRQ